MTCDWKSIPGNKVVLRRLREAIRARDAVAFIGAGASAGLYPLWAELIKHLADESLSRGRTDPNTHRYWLEQSGTYPDQVVRQIKSALGEGSYAEELRNIFRPKTGIDGRRFTPLQGALLRLPFKGYVTTNFDPGVLEARLKQRPDCPATGFGTWRDTDTVYRWSTGEIFEEQPCPVLFAHGIYERADTVVLGAAEYRDAYRSGPFRNLFLNLWRNARLVFIGFGFSDPWIRFLANEVLTSREGDSSQSPRHIALLGLQENEEYSPFMRDLFQEQYGAELLLYPIIHGTNGRPDHGALQSIIDEVASGIEPPECPKPSLPVAAPAAIPHRWSHKTSEDELFTGRADEFIKLDRWAADPSVRVIAVTGLGGMGKTSLIGRWLKVMKGFSKRPHQGLFFWSFYSNPDVASFVRSLTHFAVKQLGAPLPKFDRVKTILTLLQTKAIILALDGLEIKQQGPGTVRYGTLLPNDLHGILDGACRMDHHSLVVLTSRFPFADLSPYLGSGFRMLELDHLSADEGAALLERCALRGTLADRQDISRRIDGHPLGLRLFALLLNEEGKRDPITAIREIFDSRLQPFDDAPLGRKLQRLLQFYDASLPRVSTAILGLVSLFRIPIPERTILQLGRDLPIVKEVLSHLSDAEFRHALHTMSQEHLLVRDWATDGTRAWSCHPILQDHFRRVLLQWGAEIGIAAASLVAGQPSLDSPEDAAAVEPLVAAVELLLEADDFDGADQLYRSRLRNGRVFIAIPAPAEGLRCASSFVRDAERKKRCEQKLSLRRLSFYLNEAGLFAKNAGDFVTALECFEGAGRIDGSGKDWRNYYTVLVNQSELLAIIGRLAETEARLREALALADSEFELDQRISHGLLLIAETLALQGQVREAVAALRPSGINRNFTNSRPETVSHLGVRFAIFLFRLGRLKEARTVARIGLAVSSEYSWDHNVARYNGILGAIAIRAGQLADAEEYLRSAEVMFRKSYMLSELPAVLLGRGELARRRRLWSDAILQAEEVLRLVGPRRMRLVHADALVLRASVHLDRLRFEQNAVAPERAADDLDAALAIARDCGYAWAERDALHFLGQAHDRMGASERADLFRREADELSGRLKVRDPLDIIAQVTRDGWREAGALA